MHQLIETVFGPAFKNKYLDPRHDGAVLPVQNGRVAFSTDSYVVRPLFFPGGDIGSLAVYGTVNDLAMCGARPQFLSAAFILEEGFEMEKLRRIVDSMRLAVGRCGVELVTGDTKVVDRGKGDGIFINTAGLGWVEHDQKIAPGSVRPGDGILLNGDIGRHGIAVMAMREGLSFETRIESDSAPLAEPVLRLIREGIEIHCLRDLTRGGLSTALNEISETSQTAIRIREEAIPLREDVRGACEILGLDPLYVANEGRFIAFVPAKDIGRALKILKEDPLGSGAALIGEVVSSGGAGVTMTSAIGTTRVVDMLSGEQLPRIC